jgi:hypothetical protein
MKTGRTGRDIQEKIRELILRYRDNRVHFVFVGFLVYLRIVSVQRWISDRNAERRTSAVTFALRVRAIPHFE